MVIVFKLNGKVWICVDLIKLNESVCWEIYLFLKIDFFLGEIGVFIVFSKLDVNLGFW